MRIDIGGGSVPADGHVNLDPIHGYGEWKIYAQDHWPVPDSSVESVRASHVLEHIQAGPHRLHVFNEAHRVTVPGGTFEIKLPLVNWLDEATGERRFGGWEAFADPTHVSFWVFPESLLYFTGQFAPCATYNIRPWELVSWDVLGYGEGHAFLRKP